MKIWAAQSQHRKDRPCDRHVKETIRQAHASCPVWCCKDQVSLEPQRVWSSKSGPGMWRTGLRASIYEVQCECLSWWMMDSKLITPPPPVLRYEQNLWWGAHHKDQGLMHSVQHTHRAEDTLYGLGSWPGSGSCVLIQTLCSIQNIIFKMLLIIKWNTLIQICPKCPINQCRDIWLLLTWSIHATLSPKMNIYFVIYLFNINVIVARVLFDGWGVILYVHTVSY